MPYPPELVQPMREELTRIGVTELQTADEVRKTLSENAGTALLVINSVCGCAAGNARPAVAAALTHEHRPDQAFTVFAGQDLDATAAAREFIVGYPPSSPAIALFQGRDPVLMLERKDIEGRTAQDVARDLIEAFDRFCGAGTP